MPVRSPAQLADLLKAVSVVNVVEDNPMRNVGDHWSAVGRNVAWVDTLGAVITLKEAQSLRDGSVRSPLQGKLLIVGGSGLVGPGPFEDAVESLFPQRPIAVVFWGIGHNVLFGLKRDHDSRWRPRLTEDERTLLWPEYFARARLIGVRDFNTTLPWVPCASCLMPQLDVYREVSPDHDFVVINGAWDPIDTSVARQRGVRFPNTNNNTEDAGQLLAAIASARVVVSNSYHALYWGALLGRGLVLVPPYDSRYLHFRWPLIRAGALDWLDAVEHAAPAPDALAEARAVTAEFSATVLGLGYDLGVVDARETFDPAAAVTDARPL